MASSVVGNGRGTRQWKGRRREHGRAKWAPLHALLLVELGVYMYKRYGALNWLALSPWAKGFEAGIKLVGIVLAKSREAETESDE
jgi:hypothetical protein